MRRAALARGGACALAAALAALGAPAPAAAKTRADDAAIRTLVESERAFARTSLERGTKEAFLTFLSDTGLIFRPTAVNGKKSWSARENPRSTLAWAPAYAEISAAGDLGLTTGPWTLQTNDEKKTRYDGRFVSVWRRSADQPWRVVADMGIVHELPYRGVSATDLDLGPVHPPSRPPKKTPDLAALDRALGAATAKQPAGQAHAKVTSWDFRLLRGGTFPYDRPRDAFAALDSMAGRLAFKPEGGGIAASADFGYTYGQIERFPERDAPPADTTVYLHVWRREGSQWKLSLAVMNPLR